MKYLILLALMVACGKHDMPSEKDLADNDGDQTPNHLEISEFEKNVANVSTFGEVTATLRFQIGDSGIERNVVELNNNLDLKAYSKELMTASTDKIRLKDYFSEFSDLQVTAPSKFAIGDLKEIPVRIMFDNLKNATHLFFTIDGQRREIGEISTAMNFYLNRDELNKLLANEAHLTLADQSVRAFYHPTQSQSIQKNTYRVYMDDGFSSTTYYVSKRYPFSKFLEHFNITGYRRIEEVSLLTTSYGESEKEWWVRDVNSQDKVIIHEDLKTLSSFYLQDFNHHQQAFVRENGEPQHPLSFQKAEKGQAFLKIRMKKINHTFKEYIKEEKWTRGSPKEGGDYGTCDNLFRKIVSTSAVTPDADYLRSQLRILVDGTLYSDYLLIPGEDKNGQYWEIPLPAVARSFSTQLIRLSAAEFYRTGRIQTCSQFELSKKTASLENLFELSVESFIENI